MVLINYQRADFELEILKKYETCTERRDEANEPTTHKERKKTNTLHSLSTHKLYKDNRFHKTRVRVKSSLIIALLLT